MLASGDRAAAIILGPGARSVHASNRGHDSIASFSIDEETGRLTVIGIVPAGGRTPRFIDLVPDHSGVLSASDESHSLSRLQFGSRGDLGEASIVAAVRSPVCVAWRACG